VNNIFFNAIAGLAMAAATMQTSLAEDQPAADAPISIASCRVVPTYESALSTEGGVGSSPTGASVWISFLNRTARTITGVTFLLDTPDGPVTITDEGRFSGGVPIQHALGPFADLSGDASCVLYSVRFDDGTVWLRT
jgi:hypothetical protein